MALTRTHPAAGVTLQPVIHADEACLRPAVDLGEANDRFGGDARDGRDFRRRVLLRSRAKLVDADGVLRDVILVRQAALEALKAMG